MGNGRAAAVMAAAAREHPAVGRYALLLAEGFAVDPDLADPTGVLAAAFADLAAPLIARHPGRPGPPPWPEPPPPWQAPRR